MVGLSWQRLRSRHDPAAGASGGAAADENHASSRAKGVQRLWQLAALGAERVLKLRAREQVGCACTRLTPGERAMDDPTAGMMMMMMSLPYLSLLVLCLQASRPAKRVSKAEEDRRECTFRPRTNWTSGTWLRRRKRVLEGPGHGWMERCGAFFAGHDELQDLRILDEHDDVRCRDYWDVHYIREKQRFRALQKGRGKYEDDDIFELEMADDSGGDQDED